MNDPRITKARYLSVGKKFGLTKRELELGFLKVSEQTVKNHFTHIYEKAWVPGRKEFKDLFMKNE